MTELPATKELDDLHSLSKAVWGNPQAVLKYDDHIGVQYIDLSGHVDAFKFLFGGAIRYSKILVRHEYRLALQALETDIIYNDGAYVTGQSGIGKTLFLAYVLISRLGNQRAVACQYKNGAPLYVVFSQEKPSVHHMNDTDPVRKFAPLWGLSDSNAQSSIPIDTFYYDVDRVKAIQATSPEKHRWKNWSKDAGAKCYVMDIWSEEEIADLARLLDLDVGRMTLLAKRWGGAPRRLLDFLRDSDGMIEKFYKSVVATSVQRCKEMLPAIEANDYSDEASSPFYFCRPRTEPGLVLRRFSRAVVPTATLCTLLAEALRRQDNLVRLSFFRALRQFPGTRSAAGYIFANWFHGFCLASRTFECHWLQGGQGVVQLQGTDNLAPTSWSDVNVIQPPYYWLAPTGFPGIDCALVLETRVYAIQVSSNHPSPIEGLKNLQANLPEDSKGLPWSVLFVGDDDSSAEAVAMQWLGKVPFPSKEAPLAIGWSALDPVIQTLPWKEYRSMSKSQADEGSDEASMQVGE